MNKSKNPCSRCGNERIVVRTWEEKVWDSVIVNTETKCPNPECQKEVDSDNQKVKIRNEQNRLRSKNRIRNTHTSKGKEEKTIAA